MVHRLRVIEKYLGGYTPKVATKKTLDEESMSKEDPVVQAKAAEKLINNTIRSKLPQWKDKVFAVGGFVRDSLLGKGADDLDILADDPEHKMESGKELAEQLADVFGIKTPNNPQALDDQFKIYGLVLANPKVDGKREPFITPDGIDVSGYKLEITPPRKEGEYDEKRRPKTVEYTSREEDALRRDLTINSMLKNITKDNLENSEENIEDYSGGIEDLKNRTLRKPEHPDRGPLDIYFDDPLRILRLVRFKGKMGDFNIDPGTEKDAKKFMSSPEGRAVFKDKVSTERVKDELVKILTLPNGKDAREGLEKMNDYNLLDFVSPTLSKMLDVRHDTIHHKGESGWEHTMDVLEKTPPKIETRLAALLHDIGKTETYTPKKEYYNKEVGEWVEPKKNKPIPEGVETRDRHSFPDHAETGAGIAEKILRELKFDSGLTKAVAKMTQSHMGFKHADPSDKDFLYRARVLVSRLYENIDDIIDLMKADLNESHMKPEEYSRFQRTFEELKRIKKEDQESGLITPSGSGGYTYSDKIPVTIEDLKDFKNKAERGKLFGALKELARIRRMSGRYTSDDEYMQEIEEIRKDSNILKSLLNEHEKYKGSGKFFKKFERNDKRFYKRNQKTK